MWDVCVTQANTKHSYMPLMKLRVKRSLTSRAKNIHIKRVYSNLFSDSFSEVYTAILSHQLSLDKQWTKTSLDRKCKMPGREGNTAVTRPANYFAVSFLQVMSFLAVFCQLCVHRYYTLLRLGLNGWSSARPI